MSLTQERRSERLLPYDPDTAHHLYLFPHDAKVVEHIVSELFREAGTYPVSVELLKDPEDAFPTLAIDVVAGDSHDEARIVVTGFRRLHPDVAPSGARLCYGVVQL